MDAFEPTPGAVYDGLPEETYHGSSGYSSSQLKVMYQWSPLHFHHARPIKDSDAMKEGRLLHAMVLEPDTVADRFAFLDQAGDKPRANKKTANYTDEEKAYVLAAEEAKTTGKTVMSGSAEPFQRIADAIQAHPLWEKMQGPEPIVERSYWWIDEPTGLLLKFRADSINTITWFNGDRALVVDLKSSRDPRPAKFARQAVDLGYEFSAAMYCEGARKMLGKPVDFCWFAFEKEAPYGVSIAFPDNKMRVRGENYFRSTVDRLATCVREDVWPGIGNGRPIIIKKPHWAADRPEEENQ